MREAFAITGKIVTGTATETDRRRLEHLCADQSRSLKKRIEFTGKSRDWPKNQTKAKR